MINSKNVVASLRRDATFVWHAVIAVVFIGFASLAVAAGFLDLLGIRHLPRVAVPLPVVVFDNNFGMAICADSLDVVRADGRFAVATWNVKHVSRLAQTGQSTAKHPHQFLPNRQVSTEMAGT